MAPLTLSAATGLVLAGLVLLAGGGDALVLGILGITALVSPIPVSAAIIRSDMWWMIGTALVMLPLLWSGAKLMRLEGGILAATYAAYIALLLAR